MKRHKKATRKKKKPKPQKIEMWDPELCKRCGECCRIKFITDMGEEIALDSYCPGLNTKTKLCMMYDARFMLEASYIRGAECLNIFSMISNKEAPPSCAYAVKYGGADYNGPEFEKERLKLVPLKTRIWWKINTAVLRLMVKRWVRERAKKEVTEDVV